ncbi:mCG1033166, partial [Mus musculus]
LLRTQAGNLILCFQNEADEKENPTEPLLKRPCLSPEVDSTPCMPAAAFPLQEIQQSFDLVTTTETEMADDELTAGTTMPLQVLQGKTPDEVFSLSNEEQSIVRQAWFTGKEVKNALTDQGQKWKQGMWTKEEINMLTNNIELYMEEHGVDNPPEIIFKMSKSERKDFYRSISLVLNRPLFSIYRRVVRMYDDRNHVGKYSPEEIKKLKELWQKHGDDWISIGTAMGRSPSSVKDRC